jgi:hypothetical protein
MPKRLGPFIMLNRWMYISIFVLLSCSSRNHKDLKINVFFRHSFARPLNLKIEKTKDDAKAFVEVLQYGDSSDSLVLLQLDSALLSKEEWANFVDILGNTSLLELRSDSSGMFDGDGGATYFSVIQDKVKNEFIAGDAAAFSAGNPYEHLIEAAFYLLYSKFPRLEKFVERNRRYYSRDFRVKVLPQAYRLQSKSLS